MDRKTKYVSLLKNLLRLAGTSCLTYAGILSDQEVLIAAGLLLTWAEIFQIAEKI